MPQIPPFTHDDALRPATPAAPSSSATGRLRWLLRRTGSPGVYGSGAPFAERVLQQEYRVRRTNVPAPGVIVEEFETVWRDVPEVIA